MFGPCLVIVGFCLGYVCLCVVVCVIFLLDYVSVMCVYVFGLYLSDVWSVLWCMFGCDWVMFGLCLVVFGLGLAYVRDMFWVMIWVMFGLCLVSD